MIQKSNLFTKQSLLLGVSLTVLAFPSLAHAQEMSFEVEDENVNLELETVPMPEPAQNIEEDFSMEFDAMPAAPAPDGDQLVETMVVEDVPTGPAVVPHSGTYYDSSSFGGNSISSTAPREVDPKYEPGSRYVVVERNAGAGSFSSQMVSAQRALSLGRYAAALEIYEELYQKNSGNHRVLMGLAVAQQRSGFTESALATYEELLKHEPNNANALVNMLGIISAVNPERAYAKLQAMWAENRRSPAIASQLGFTAAELGDYDRAIRYLGIASSMEPTNPNHYYNMGVISDRAGKIKQAIEYYQKSLEMDASTNAFRTVSREVVYDRLATLRRL